MFLIDSKKREIVKCLENNKPLPEKYTFLLFDDKREIELVWNGKNNEVCNVDVFGNDTMKIIDIKV
ncbi:hypothetical protein KA977_11795 [Candidatus Dependentiae bacterium]|nr:hypothetical protein [Candidatus Dependentiae bacterium]